MIARMVVYCILAFGVCPAFAGNTVQPKLPPLPKVPIKGGTNASVGIDPSIAKNEVSYSTVLKLGQARTWKNAEGKEISAELVSWPLPGATAATTDASKVQFELIKQGQIRLRQAKQTYSVVLSTLSEADQAYVKQIEASAKSAGQLIPSAPATKP